MSCHCLLTGEIYLNNCLQYEEIVDIAYYLTQIAIDNKIGLNLNYNLTESGRQRYPVCDYINNNGYVPYEILDNPLSSDCFSMFDNIYYAEETGKISFIENSNFFCVQNFFKDIINHKNILYIIFEMQDVHLYGTINFTEYQIRATQFCETVINAPLVKHYYSMPAVRFKIVK